MTKRIHIIINPAAGNDEPVLSYINKSFYEKDIEWDISITHKKDDATRLAEYALKQNYDIICAYGGDGTVMEVAKALAQSQTPMGIIPGGTANVLANELGIPTNTQEALTLIAADTLSFRTIDMGLCNSERFFIRITMGDLALMVTEASRELKDTFGQIAYGITAAKHLGKDQKIQFMMNIDGEKISAEGVTLMVTNTGNLGVKGMSLIPSISVEDGYFDVILFEDTNLTTLASLAGSVLLQNQPEGILKYWKGKNITIECAEEQPTILDDITVKTKKLEISIVPQSLKIVAPAKTE